MKSLNRKRYDSGESIYTDDDYDSLDSTEGRSKETKKQKLARLNLELN